MLWQRRASIGFAVVVGVALLGGPQASGQPHDGEGDKGAAVILEFYAVDDLLVARPAPLHHGYRSMEGLMADIRSVTGPEQWTDPDTILEHQQAVLIVRQRPAVQAQVARFLESLRRHQQVVVTLQVETVEGAAGLLQDVGLPPSDDATLPHTLLEPFQRQALLRAVTESRDAGRSEASRYTTTGRQALAVPVEEAGVLLVRPERVDHGQIGLEARLVWIGAGSRTAPPFPAWLQAPEGATFLVGLPGQRGDIDRGLLVTVTAIDLRQAEAEAAAAEASK